MDTKQSKEVRKMVEGMELLSVAGVVAAVGSFCTGVKTLAKRAGKRR